MPGVYLALLGYPLLLEPNLRLTEQSWLWAGGYGLQAALVLTCALTLWRSTWAPDRELSPGSFLDLQKTPAIADGVGALTVGRRIHWVVLSFVPSSLLLGLTAYLTTDLPAIPLFWTVPLAIYLLTFVLVFARNPFSHIDPWVRCYHW